MAKKFVRGITDINKINDQDFDTNNVNDLLSDGEHNYIHRKKKDKTEEYHNLTNNIKTISSDNTDLLSVTNYNNTNNTATLHPHHDAQKDQLLESERTTININHGTNGTAEKTKVDTNPQKVLEHDHLMAGSNLTKEHTQGSNTTTLKVADAFVNRVTTAENKIKEVESKIPTEVGGRNLLTKTNQGAEGWGWTMQKGDSSAVTVDSNGVKAVKITKGNKIPQSGWSSIQYSNLMFNLIEPNTKYVLSFDVFPSATVSFKAKIANSDGSNQLVDVITMTEAPANKWTKVRGVFTNVPNLLADHEKQVLALLGMPSDNGVSYIIKNIKLEKGFIPSDWTPAPEDIDTEITQLSTEVEGLAPNQTTYGTRGQELYAVKELFGIRKTFYIEMTTREKRYTIPAGSSLARDLLDAMGGANKVRRDSITLARDGANVIVENSSTLTDGTDYAEFSFCDADNQLTTIPEIQPE